MSSVHYINLGQGVANVGAIRYAWRSPNNSPSKKIRDNLGWIQAKKGEKGLVFGANQPKPAKVRINFKGGGSTTAFCDPSKVEGVTIGGNLNGEKWDVDGRFRNAEISRVTSVQG